MEENGRVNKLMLKNWKVYAPIRETREAELQRE